MVTCPGPDPASAVWLCASKAFWPSASSSLRVIGGIRDSVTGWMSGGSACCASAATTGNITAIRNSNRLRTTASS